MHLLTACTATSARCRIKWCIIRELCRWFSFLSPSFVYRFFQSPASPAEAAATTQQQLPPPPPPLPPTL
ncbi:hypothetical protein M0802_007706 [Mischocyttarus mexicanus]|nr:hypothetical protein M0802_007706 [Mischocyttarus mexicanus]